MGLPHDIDRVERSRARTVAVLAIVLAGLLAAVGAIGYAVKTNVENAELAGLVSGLKKGAGLPAKAGRAGRSGTGPDQEAGPDSRSRAAQGGEGGGKGARENRAKETGEEENPEKKAPQR